MYRQPEKVQQSDSSGGSEYRGKVYLYFLKMTASSLPVRVAIESTSLPHPQPPRPNLTRSSLRFNCFTGAKQEDELGREDYVKPQGLHFDYGHDNPYRSVHGVPLHNVVDEEEE